MSQDDSPLSRLLPGEHKLLVPGPCGPLQVVVQVPAQARPDVLALICHPHSLMGGSLDNKVVFTLHRVARDLGVASVRFNFRGVGASAGVYDQGTGEQDDLLAVLAWADPARRRRLWLAGFSFGAFVAAMTWPRALAAGWPPLGLVLAAPPVTRFPLDGHALPAGARVIYGDADEVVEPQAIAAWLSTQPAGVAVSVLEGAGHFFHGRLGELKDWVAAGLQENLDHV